MKVHQPELLKEKLRALQLMEILDVYLEALKRRGSGPHTSIARSALRLLWDLIPISCLLMISLIKK